MSVPRSDFVCYASAFPLHFHHTLGTLFGFQGWTDSKEVARESDEICGAPFQFTGSRLLGSSGLLTHDITSFSFCFSIDSSCTTAARGVHSQTRTPPRITPTIFRVGPRLVGKERNSRALLANSVGSPDTHLIQRATMAASTNGFHANGVAKGQPGGSQPCNIGDLTHQVSRALARLRSIPGDLEKYTFLQTLKSRQEDVFYSLVLANTTGSRSRARAPMRWMLTTASTQRRYRSSIRRR